MTSVSSDFDVEVTDVYVTVYNGPKRIDVPVYVLFVASVLREKSTSSLAVENLRCCCRSMRRLTIFTLSESKPIGSLFSGPKVHLSTGYSRHGSRNEVRAT